MSEQQPTFSSVDRFSFIAEWYELESSILRKFFLFYYPVDHTISLYDADKKRMFLKRTSVENITKEDMFVGNTMKIYGRQFKIVNYANTFTERMMGVNMQKTFALIKPEAVKHKGQILKLLINSGFKISQLRMMRLTDELAQSLYSSNKETLGFPALISHMTSGPVICMELLCDNGVMKLLDRTGPTDPAVAKSKHPESIRACFGLDEMRNAFHCAAGINEADKELDLIFGPNAPKASSQTDTVILKHSTCCVVKPHAVREGNLGNIISFIEEEGFQIKAMRMFYLNNMNAEEFLEVYRGVLKEYPEMVNEMNSGSCVALEITGPTGNDTPKDFRNLVGPSDPEMGRQLRPNTLRARFGKNKIQNAVHVTDLPEDSLIEVEYFFKILD